MKQLLSTYKSSFESSSYFSTVVNQIKEFFTQNHLCFSKVENKAVERELPRIPLAVDILLRNLYKIEPIKVKQNITEFPNISDMFGILVDNLLTKKKYDHYLLRMLNANSPYLKRLDLFIAEIRDVVNRQVIRHSIRDNGERMYDAFSELEIAYYFQKAFNIDVSKRKLEQRPYLNSKRIDFQFQFDSFTIWVEVKRFYDLDKASITNEVVLINREKFENNLWDKFQAKFPSITEEDIISIADPIIFAINMSDSSLTDIEVENYLAGTSVEVRELTKEGKYLFKETYRENDAMSQRSIVTKIISGVLLFNLKPDSSKDYRLYAKFINNPFAINPISQEITKIFNEG